MKYTQYSKFTKNYLNSVERFLTEKYGSVKEEWESVLFLLAENLDLYIQCKESVKANGIYDASTGRKNGLLTTMKDLQATIMKQVQHLGISPYSASKIKQEVDDDNEDFIEALTK